MKRALALALLLAACSREEPGAMTNGAAASPPDEPDRRIQCRLRDMEPADQYCSVTERRTSLGPVLVLRRPDGGFRRLLWVGGDLTYVAADGAEQPQILHLRHGITLIQIGGDVYYFRPRP